MPNFVNIPRQMKKFSIPALDSDRSICLAAICFSGPMSAVPTNEQRSYPKFKIDISNTEGLVRVYVD